MKRIILFSMLFLFLGMQQTTQAQQQEKLLRNIKAPNISTVDATGKKIKLQSILKDNERVLICFFRPVWCPICNKRTHELIERYEELKAKGFEVIAIYPSSPDVMAEYVKSANIPFPVIADPDEKLYSSYAIERSLEKTKRTSTNKRAMKEHQEGMKLYHGKTYEKDTDKYETIINADFVIGPKRLLEVAYYGNFVGDHYSLSEL